MIKLRISRKKNMFFTNLELSGYDKDIKNKTLSYIKKEYYTEIYDEVTHKKNKAHDMINFGVPHEKIEEFINWFIGYIIKSNKKVCLIKDGKEQLIDKLNKMRFIFD